MSNPFLSATESWAKEREDLDAAEAAAADGYTSIVSVPVLKGRIYIGVLSFKNFSFSASVLNISGVTWSPAT